MYQNNHDNTSKLHINSALMHLLFVQWRGHRSKATYFRLSVPCRLCYWGPCEKFQVSCSWHWDQVSLSVSLYMITKVSRMRRIFQSLDIHRRGRWYMHAIANTSLPIWVLIVLASSSDGDYGTVPAPIAGRCHFVAYWTMGMQCYWNPRSSLGGVISNCTIVNHTRLDYDVRWW